MTTIEADYSDLENGRDIYGVKTITLRDGVTQKEVIEVDAISRLSAARVGATILVAGTIYTVTGKGSKFRRDVRDHRLYLYVTR